MTDDELMARAAAGEEPAIRALVERWEHPVFAFLARMLGSREEAEDLGQETFLRVIREAARYRASGRFRGWLFRIAGNLARSRLRRRRVVQWLRFDPAAHDRPSPEDSPDRAIERDEARDRVRRALRRLPDRQREAIVLRQYEGMSYREIAVAMNVTERAVDALLQRATSALRRDLAGEEAPE